MASHKNQRIFNPLNPWLTQLRRRSRSRNMSRNGACIVPPPRRLSCGSHLTITLISSRSLSGDSGSPRWVLHGTPASGAGIIGCLETGVSVIALCENVHHRKHLDIALRERAVEAMLAGSRIFKDEALQARELEFCPTTAWG